MMEPHPGGIFHLLKPGGARQPGTPYTNMGVYSLAEPRPDERTDAAGDLRDRTRPRVYIGNPSRAEQNRILDEAESRGATVLWRDRYWAEFEGFHGAFRDPWGNEIVLWAVATSTDEIPTDSPY